MSECIPSDPILTSVKVRLPGVTDDLINLELFNTLNEFFRSTSAWRYEATIALSEGTREYALFPPNGTALVRVMEVTHKGSAVNPTLTGGAAASQRGRLTADNLFGDGDAAFDPDTLEPGPGNAFNYAIFYPTYLMIDIPPDTEAIQHPIIAIIAISLSHECLQCDCGEWSVPDWMWDMYFENWLDGVLARLMSMPAKPWSNPTLAQYHGRRFRNAISFRKQEARRGFVYDVPAWQFPSGGFILR